MIGRIWPREDRVFTDSRTGRTIRQLTHFGNNVHLYFTENAFAADAGAIVFISDRASAERRAPHNAPHYNIFRMDLGTGEITQLTDEPKAVRNVTKTADDGRIAYLCGRDVKVLDTLTGQVTTVYHEAGNYTMTTPSVSADRRYLAFGRNEMVEVQVEGQRSSTGDHYDLPNYTGFKDRYYLVKDGRITVARIDPSGPPCETWFDAHCDTHQVGHVQFSPADPTVLMFCHEGPWNLVTQRMWGLDLLARGAYPLFRQNEQDSIGHEFWTQDGLIFFDNRGPGHDGTITSTRTQAVVTDVAVKQQHDFVPFVGLMDRWGRLLRRIDLPYYCNHYHAGPTNTLLVGDDVDELVLIDASGERPSHTVLCEHGTSWHTQASHCHPTWSRDGKRILYASDRGGMVNLYLIDM